MSSRKEHAEGTDRSDFLCVSPSRLTPPANQALIHRHQLRVPERLMPGGCLGLVTRYIARGDNGNKDARLGTSRGSSFCTRSDSERQACPILPAIASQPARGVTLRNPEDYVLSSPCLILIPSSDFIFFLFIKLPPARAPQQHSRWH